jgi:hypothetical protein
MLKINTYPMTRRTDRDVELPNLLAFAKEKKGTYESLLDVGAHFSAGYYANDLRLLAKQYHGLDPGYDESVKMIVDRYIQEDFLQAELQQYDFVLCLSTIEHVGMYPIIYQDRENTRDVFFQKLLAITKKYLWFSFPMGQAYEIPGEMSIIPPEQVKRWLELIKPYKATIGYFWNAGAQAGHPWEVSNFERLAAQKYNDRIGTQAVCIMEIEK